MRRLRRNAFLVGLAVTISVAYLAPGLGRAFAEIGGKKAAVVVIFLLSGFTVRPRSIGEDLRHWPVHLLIQGFNLVLIPLLVFLTTGWVAGPARLGLFLMAAVPTTVSSCVAFTMAARGRASCALVNAMGGNLLGVVVSPLLLGLMVGVGGAVGGGQVLRSMVTLVYVALIPFAVGETIGAVFGRPGPREARLSANVSQFCILLVILGSFSKSLPDLLRAMGGMWPCVIYIVGAHLVFVGMALACVRLFHFPPSLAPAVVFCSTQKTLGMGLPLADAFFEGGGVPLAVVYLPLMVYHLFQLALGGVLVNQWTKRKAE